MKSANFLALIPAIFLLIPNHALAVTAKEAVEQAIATYPSIESGKEKVAADRDLLKGFWMNLLPSLNTNEQALHTSVNPTGTGMGYPKPVASALWTYGFTAPIFDSGSTIFQAQAEKNTMHAQEHMVDVIKNTVALNALQAYVAVDVARQQLTTYKDLRTKLVVLSKTTSNSAQLNALIQADISEMDNSIFSATQSNIQAENNYIAIIGQKPDDQMQSLDEIGVSLEIPKTPDEAYDAAKDLSPSLLVLRSQIDVAKSNRRGEVAKDLGPTANYSWLDSSGIRNLGGGKDIDPTVRTGTLTAGVNISFGSPFRIRAATHAVKSAEYDLQTASIQLKNQFDTNYSQRESLVAQIKSLRAAYATASSAYDSAAAQIDSGQAVDVTSTRLILTNMKTATDSILTVDPARILVRAQILGMIGTLEQY